MFPVVSSWVGAKEAPKIQLSRLDVQVRLYERVREGEGDCERIMILSDETMQQDQATLKSKEEEDDTV